MSNQSAPTYPKHVAKAVVRKINSHVNAMIGTSTIIEGSWEKKDDILGLFDKSEVQLGKLLGSGGFSNVFEVTGFRTSGGKRLSPIQSELRTYYSDNATDENGKSKYVVKQIKPKLMSDTSKFCMAAADMVVEAQFLSSLHHKNILRIRGWSCGGINALSDGQHGGYFLILDRLDDTLDKRIESWRKERSDVSSKFGRLTLKSGFSAELLSRTKIVHQIASGLKYLHENNMVFRDLKPNNVGFDENGTVKIFDFGLSRELPNPCVDVDDVYHMSGKIGTVRFMAPEVALSKHYNQKVDTYSWAMLFWNCLTLEKPYAEMTRPAHIQQVCRHGERPALSSSWPESIRRVLKRAWAQDAYTRYTMAETCAHLDRIERELQGEREQSKVSRTSFLSRPSLIRRTSNTLVSMAA